MTMRLLLHMTLLLLLLSSPTIAFTSVLPSTLLRNVHYDEFLFQQQQVCHTRKTNISTPSSYSTTTRLYALLDVPDDFFTILLPTLSLFLAFSKAVARSRLEERAWEQRLEEARLEQLERDPTLTEFDLRKREAAAEWSAYGNNHNNDDDNTDTTKRRRRQTRVMTRESTTEETRREFTMTQQEIQDFQDEFGVEYDPYYDDPYTKDELPMDVPFKVDKLYGDRIYKDGEVFYKDANSGLYYRQGSQPRIQKFW